MRRTTSTDPAPRCSTPPGPCARSMSRRTTGSPSWPAPAGTRRAAPAARHRHRRPGAGPRGGRGARPRAHVGPAALGVRALACHARVVLRTPGGSRVPSRSSSNRGSRRVPPSRRGEPPDPPRAADHQGGGPRVVQPGDRRGLHLSTHTCAITSRRSSARSGSEPGRAVASCSPSITGRPCTRPGRRSRTGSTDPRYRKSHRPVGSVERAVRRAPR